MNRFTGQFKHKKTGFVGVIFYFGISSAARHSPYQAFIANLFRRILPDKLHPLPGPSFPP
ncbi:MAG: hypothetical protein LBL64_09070 [Treponema sp.]|nr:hypothetical protein [Treponema sp.]